MDRRRFLTATTAATLGTLLTGRLSSQERPALVEAYEFPRLPSPEYHDVHHDAIAWEETAPGLAFARVPVYRAGELVDIIAALRIDPERNTILVTHGYSRAGTVTRTIEEWQERTGAIAMINGAQYMRDPAYMPVARVLSNARPIGPRHNQHARGMLASNPAEGRLDLIDFAYEPDAQLDQRFTEGVTHWPILLNREGAIRVTPTLWQANRTVVAKAFDEQLLFFTTEGGYFTLFNFGRFLKESNARPDHGFNVHTAMNMDGGYEANMVVRTPRHHYTTYGEFETYGPGQDVTIRNIKIPIPGVVGVHPLTDVPTKRDWLHE